jgi:hypothetical protein
VGLFDLGLASSERDFLEGIPADLTRATDLKQKFETSREDQRTNWTVNVQPPTARTWLWSRDTSTPNCFMVSGQITQGFCGKRYRLKANGERVKSDVVFDGKYINSYCGGSRAEALALSDDFTIVNQGADREKCMALLLESRLVQDCESIRGRYNVHEMVKARRSLLPDCCVAYIENTKQDRMDCNCRHGPLRQHATHGSHALLCCVLLRGRSHELGARGTLQGRQEICGRNQGSRAGVTNPVLLHENAFAVQLGASVHRQKV